MDVNELRAEVRSLDPELPVGEIRSMEQVVMRSAAKPGIVIVFITLSAATGTVVVMVPDPDASAVIAVSGGCPAKAPTPESEAQAGNSRGSVNTFSVHVTARRDTANPEIEMNFASW